MATLWAPASLLYVEGLSATAKVLWLAFHLQNQRSLPDLQAACGFSPNTIRHGLAELSPFSHGLQGRTVPIPCALLAERHVGAQAKLLYGLLQLTPAFSDRDTKVTYTALSKRAHVARNTVKLATRELVEAGWLRVVQSQPNAAPHFTLLNPVLYRQRQELARAKRRLDKPRFGGEALMRELLSALVESDQSEDDAAPGLLVNPLTDERLQFDRFYPPGVAFEFNGAQHYGVTEWFPNTEELKERKLRDLLKAGICFYRGVTLVVVHAEDLSLEGMRTKVGKLLPMRDLTGHDLLVNYLEKKCLQYRNGAHRA